MLQPAGRFSKKLKQSSYFRKQKRICLLVNVVTIDFEYFGFKSAYIYTKLSTLSSKYLLVMNFAVMTV